MPDDPPKHEFEPPGLDELAKALQGYEIMAFIAKGGMGAVYMARQKSLDRKVAIKILPSHFGDDEKFRARFTAEAKNMAKLNHPNIISVHDYGEYDDQPYIVMEMVHGKSLYHSARGKMVEPRQAGRIIRDICLGLAHAHKQGILHRDLKPANILLTPDRTPKIGDFGLARHISDHQADIGYYTPGYTAPEVAKDPTAVNESTDLYSVGIMLYELLAGKRPEEPYVPVASTGECDPEFDRIILKAIDPLPDNRYPSAKEMAEAIDKVIKEEAPVPGANLVMPSPKKLLVDDAAVAKPLRMEGALLHPATWIGRQAKSGPSASLIRNMVIVILLALGVSYAWKGWQKFKGKPATKDEQVAKSGQQAKKSKIPWYLPHQGTEETEQPGSAVGKKTKYAAPSNESKRPAPLTGKVAFGGSQYQLIEKRMTWHEARDYCEQLGGHLAIVTSKEESDFVARLAGSDDVWLGATDAHKEGDWRWLDGSEFEFKNWHTDQPDNLDNEDFLHSYNTGHWDDADDSTHQYYAICEWSDALKEHYALKARAAAGDVQAQIEIARRCYDGRKTIRDMPGAVHWYHKAADQGNSHALGWLGWLYQNGRGVERDEKRAVEFYRQAAVSGHSYSQFKLGLCYLRGIGIERDPVEARKWFNKAADSGNVDAQFTLGELYNLVGGGEPRQPEKALFWYQKAAGQGHAQAKQQLSPLYFEKGRAHHRQGALKDLEEAEKWYQQAADLGHAEARQELADCQFVLANLYFEGGGGAGQDAARAVALFDKAAKHGHADAQFKLAECYWKGKVVREDRLKARGLLRQAAAQGHEGAQQALDVINR